MKILIVDARLIMYQTFHKRLPITHSINYIYEFSNSYQPFNKIIYAWDSKLGSKRRKELYKDYKAHRKEVIKTEADKKRLYSFNKEYNKMETIFNVLGNVIHIDGYEADDIANIIVNEMKDKHRIYLLSSDSDWAVNIQNDNVYQIHLNKGLINIDNVKQVYGIDGINMLYAQSLMGIRKENIKGIEKLGPKRLYPLFDKYQLDEIINILQDWVDNDKYGTKIPENFSSVKEMFKYNYEVLRPLTKQDLSNDEWNLFKSQFNRKFNTSKSEAETTIYLEMNKPYLFDNKMSKFFKLT